MRESIIECVETVAKKTFDESKGRASSDKESWWWSKEVELTAKEKQEIYRELKKCLDDQAFKR